MYSGQACGDAMETFNDGITNGADWYPVTGNAKKGVFYMKIIL